MGDRLVIGCGYLGRRVAARWSAAGHRVFATTRRPGRRPGLEALGYEPVICDVNDPESLRNLPDAEAVVHCVGFDRAAGRPMRAVYVDGLGNVLAELSRRAAAGATPPRFVYVSSTGVYGQSDGGWVDEASPAEPPDESGRVVREAERLLRDRPSAVVLRFAGIYGPDRLIRAAAVRAGEPLTGDPEKWLNLIHVEDGAAAVDAAIERGGPSAVYNVADGRPVRRRDFYTRLAEVLDAPPPRFAGASPQDSADRRIANRRMREELGVTPRYPSYAEGLPASR